MKARFIGDPNDRFNGPGKLDLYGVSFEFNTWTDVPEGVGAKLEKHSHFEVEADADGEDDPSSAELRAKLDGLRVKYHHKAGPAKLAELLAKHQEGGGE